MHRFVPGAALMQAAWRPTLAPADSQKNQRRPGSGRSRTVALRTEPLSNILARDASLSEYDFWSALRRIENELYRCSKLGRPVPIELVYARRIVSSAWAKRNPDWD